MADASATATGGQAAPAQAKQQLGVAAPASGATAGTPSSPSLDSAIVAEKKKAEHWQKKYERDVGPLQETVSEFKAKLEGLVAGQGMNGQAKPPARTIAELDDSAIDEIVKKG